MPLNWALGAVREQWQKQMDDAFDNYFAVSEALKADVTALLREDLLDQSPRRNFIRAAAALMEGYAHCFRCLCQVGIASGPGQLSKKEFQVLRNEKDFSSSQRLKLTLRATYKLFELSSAPDFGDSSWENTQLLLDKRDKVMHPKSAKDIEVSDELWILIHEGAVWGFTQLFGFIEKLAREHGTLQNV